MRDQDWLTRPEAAEILRKPVTTLAAWAYRGVGPPYSRVGRSVLYNRLDLERWLGRPTLYTGVFRRRSKRYVSIR